MLIAKLILIITFLFRIYNNVKNDERRKDKDEKLGARLATATIFVVTVLVYYFAGIFNFSSVC